MKILSIALLCFLSTVCFGQKQVITPMTQDLNGGQHGIVNVTTINLLNGATTASMQGDAYSLQANDGFQGGVYLNTGINGTNGAGVIESVVGENNFTVIKGGFAVFTNNGNSITISSGSLRSNGVPMALVTDLGGGGTFNPTNTALWGTTTVQDITASGAFSGVGSGITGLSHSAPTWTDVRANIIGANFQGGIFGFDVSGVGGIFQQSDMDINNFGGVLNNINIPSGGNIRSNGVNVALVTDLGGGSVNGTNFVSKNQTNYGTLNYSNQTTSISSPLEYFNTLTNSDSSPAYYRILNASAPGAAGRYIEWEEQSTFNGIIDVVHGIGRNMKQNGILDNTNFPGEAEIIEQKYANQNNHAQLEWYHVFVDQQGHISRFLTYTANVTNFVSTEDTRIDFNSDSFQFGRSTNGAPETLAFDRNNFVYTGGNAYFTNIFLGTNGALSMDGDTSSSAGNGWGILFNDKSSSSLARNWAIAIDNRFTGNGYGRMGFGISTTKGGEVITTGQFPLILTSNTVTMNGSVSNTLISTSTGGFSSGASNLVASTSIAVGASPFSYTNTIGKNVFVYVDGAGVTGSLAKNGQQLFSALVGTDVTVPLQPGQYVTVTYTVGTPTMRFDPL